MCKTTLLAAILLAIFLPDVVLYKKSGCPQPAAVSAANVGKLGIEGGVNLLFLWWAWFWLRCFRLTLWENWFRYLVCQSHLPNLLRDMALLGLAALSLKYTSRRCRELNVFHGHH